MGLKALCKVVDRKYVILNDELLDMIDINPGDYLEMTLIKIIKKKDVIETKDVKPWE